MRVAGVVVEYNPMHNGHLYHLQQTKKETGADAIVAVMSGDFLQRGEPAIVSKWARAEMALHNGVDLVLELPVVYSTQSARLFAFGAIATLHSLGMVDSFCFGSERGDIRLLQQAADLLAESPDELQQALEAALDRGLSYPAAYAESFQKYVQLQSASLADLLNSPNNLLGIEYIRALRQLQSPLHPVTIQRTAADFHDQQLTDQAIASATAIRKAMLENSPVTAYLPTSNHAILQREFAGGRGPVTWNSFTQSIFALLARSTPEELQQYPHVEKGLEVRLLEALTAAKNVTDLIYKAKTRRYTWTRIQRALTAILLGITQQTLASLQLENGPDSIRVLGFTDTGRALLKQGTAVASLPVFTKVQKNQPAMLEANLRASQIYSLGFSVQDANNRLQEPQIPVLYRQHS